MPYKSLEEVLNEVQVLSTVLNVLLAFSTGIQQGTSLEYSCKSLIQVLSVVRVLNAGTNVLQVFRTGTK